MDAAPTTETKKRTLGFMMANELAGKLRSKADYYDYLDKHRKYFSIFFTPYRRVDSHSLLV